MNRDGLRGLAARLAEAAELARREQIGLADDYARGAVLVGDLASRLPAMSPEDRERVDLNADLPQLDFHLREDLARADGLDRDAIAGSLAFMRRHLVRIEAEWVDQVHLRIDPIDRDLVTGLARLTRQTYEQRFARCYQEAGYRRPWVDKLYRDYSLTGVPGGLLAELAAVATSSDRDAILCVLKGGLPYTILLELLGAAPVRHVMCGRASGSHVAPEYVVRPVDFEWAELTGRRVLVVDNNAATGATLGHLAAALEAVPGLRADLWLDYIVGEWGGLDADALAAQGYRNVRIGPFTARPAEPRLRRQLVRAIQEGLRRHEGLP